MNKHWTGLVSYLTGHAAENRVQIFLQSKGYRPVAQNVRGMRGSGANELDLIMLDKKMLVFIEVKKRASITDAAEVITPALQKRLYRGAEAFLATHPTYQGYDCRFDVVLINDKDELLHLKNVIEES